MEARNWKWMIPGSFVFVFIFFDYLMLSAATGLWKVAGIIPIGITYILLRAAVSNYRAYFRILEVEAFSMRRRAEVLSPTVELARAFNGLHPAYAKILTMHMNTVWAIVEGKDAEELKVVDYVLYGTRVPVHIEFVIYVLRHSTDWSVMPERLFGEGAKDFDPLKAVTDREQYQELVAYWHGQGRVTNSHGSSPAQWIYPWTPGRVAKAMDISLEDEEKKDE